MDRTMTRQEWRQAWWSARVWTGYPAPHCRPPEWIVAVLRAAGHRIIE